jgi:hypothetical protein
MSTRERKRQQQGPFAGIYQPAAQLPGDGLSLVLAGTAAAVTADSDAHAAVEQALVAHPQDADLLLDRFDARLLLDSLRGFDTAASWEPRQPEEWDAASLEAGVTAAELQAERYADLDPAREDLLLSEPYYRGVDGACRAGSAVAWVLHACCFAPCGCTLLLLPGDMHVRLRLNQPVPCSHAKLLELCFWRLVPTDRSSAACCLSRRLLLVHGWSGVSVAVACRRAAQDQHAAMLLGATRLGSKQWANESYRSSAASSMHCCFQTTCMAAVGSLDGGGKLTAKCWLEFVHHLPLLFFLLTLLLPGSALSWFGTGYLCQGVTTTCMPGVATANCVLVLLPPYSCCMCRHAAVPASHVNFCGLLTAPCVASLAAWPCCSGFALQQVGLPTAAGKMRMHSSAHQAAAASRTSTKAPPLHSTTATPVAPASSTTPQVAASTSHLRCCRWKQTAVQQQLLLGLNQARLGPHMSRHLTPYLRTCAGTFPAVSAHTRSVLRSGNSRALCCLARLVAVFDA